MNSIVRGAGNYNNKDLMIISSSPDGTYTVSLTEKGEGYLKSSAARFRIAGPEMESGNSELIELGIGKDLVTTAGLSAVLKQMKSVKVPKLAKGGRIGFITTLITWICTIDLWAPELKALADYVDGFFFGKPRSSGLDKKDEMNAETLVKLLANLPFTAPDEYVRKGQFYNFIRSASRSDLGDLTSETQNALTGLAYNYRSALIAYGLDMETAALATNWLIASEINPLSDDFRNKFAATVNYKTVHAVLNSALPKIRRGTFSLPMDATYLSYLYEGLIFGDVIENGNFGKKKVIGRIIPEQQFDRFLLENNSYWSGADAKHRRVDMFMLLKIHQLMIIRGMVHQMFHLEFIN